MVCAGAWHHHDPGPDLSLQSIPIDVAYHGFMGFASCTGGQHLYFHAWTQLSRWWFYRRIDYVNGLIIQYIVLGQDQVEQLNKAKSWAFIWKSGLAQASPLLVSQVLQHGLDTPIPDQCSHLCRTTITGQNASGLSRIL